MNSNCAFVYVLSVVLCNERVSYLKVCLPTAHVNLRLFLMHFGSFVVPPPS